MTIRILLADHEPMFRDVLRAAIEPQHDLQVVGEAANGREAVDFVEANSPDVAVVEAMMPELNGIEATRRIVAAGKTNVVVVSERTDRRSVSAALDAGALGYVVKTAPVDELLRAIRTVHLGRRFASAGVDVPGEECVAAQPTLGSREREVLQLLAEGLTTAEIAGRMGIKRSTVGTHRRNVMRKLDLHTIAELTKYAVREGLTPP